MQRVHYAGGEILTGDEIAKALVAYAEALAKSETSATAWVPILNVDGSVTRAELLIGPASQIIGVPEESEFPELVDADTVATFTSETRKLGPSSPKVSSVAEPGYDDEY